MRRFGEIRSRTQQDKNEYILHETYAEIIIYNIKSEPKDVKFKIDLEDVDLCKQYKWCNNLGDYASTTILHNKRIILHRLIMKAEKGQIIDHINGDRTDNRKSNLRFATNRQNSRNHIVRNKFGVSGIHETKYGTYEVSITVDGKKKYLGYYPTLEEAIKTRLDAENIYYGEFRPRSDIKT